MTQRGILREVSWRELFPWLVILRSFRLSISLPVLFLATIATLVTPLGWQVSSFFLTENDREILTHPAVDQARTWSSFSANEQPSLSDRRWLSTILANQQESRLRIAAPSLAALVQHEVSGLVSRMEGVYYQLSLPFRALFRRDLTVTQFAFFLGGGLWTLAVWSLFGGVITRIAVMRLGREERVSLKDAFRLTLARYRSLVSGPLVLLFVIAFLALLMTPVGLLTRLDAGLLVVGGLWFGVLAIGFLLTLIFFGLLFGWPLMWPTISSEVQGDAFEAVQRSFSYSYERPLHYLFYAFVAAVTGSLGWIAVDLFCETVIYASLWSVSYGAGIDRYEQLRLAANGMSGDGGPWGASCIWFWVSLTRSIKVAYGFSFFWCAASAIYLVLRQDVDATEFDEIYVEGEENRYDLPTLDHSDSSVPGVVKDDENDATTSTS